LDETNTIPLASEAIFLRHPVAEGDHAVAIVPIGQAQSLPLSENAGPGFIFSHLGVLRSGSPVPE
jgi:hypothetical protein